METTIINSSDLTGLSDQELKKFIKTTYPKNTELIICTDTMTKKTEVFEKGKTLLDYDEDVAPPSSYVLPTLYKLDKKDKEMMWKIWAVKDTVFKSYGKVGGNLIPSARTFTGVNIGKKNETSPAEQAKRWAERDWVKQFDKGYTPKSKEGKAFAETILKAKQDQGNSNAGVAALIRGENPPTAKAAAKSAKKKENNGAVPGYECATLPMVCQTWTDDEKTKKYFDFENGVYIQTKADGVRAFVRIVNGKVVFITRNGKQIVWLKNLRADVLTFLQGFEDVILDGEIYAETITGVCTYSGKKHTYAPGDTELTDEQRFEVISGAARPVRGEPHPLEDQLCLHVFDIADETGTLDQDDRFAILKKLFSRKGMPPRIKRIITKVVYSVAEMKEYHDKWAEMGYEGVVLRARDLTYESNRRSLKMRKYKSFMDSEYSICDMECDKGVGREHFRWVCETLVDGDLKTFSVKPKGTREQKWEWYDHYEDHIGKLLTVRYQDLTGDGVPRFPRGISFRDYE